MLARNAYGVPYQASINSRWMQFDHERSEAWITIGSTVAAVRDVIRRATSLYVTHVGQPQVWIAQSLSVSDITSIRSGGTWL